MSTCAKPTGYPSRNITHVSTVVLLVTGSVRYRHLVSDPVGRMT